MTAAYVLTGYGMVPAMCEEVRNPEREVPRGMVLSVLVGSLAGIAFILPVLFVLPDVAMLLQAADSQPIAPLFKVITGSAASSFGLLFLLLGVLLFAGVGALTASSRCTYAFARDGAIPGYKIWGRVNARLSVPLWALGLSTVVDCLLACIYLGSAAAFNSFTGIATLCLSCSYVVPVIVNLARRRRLVRNSPYPLGRFGPVINIICVAWIALALVIFCVPIALPVTPSSMNYASVVFTFFASVAFVWYFVYARKNFKGPPVHVDGPDDPLPPTLKDPDSGANEASVEGKLA